MDQKNFKKLYTEMHTKEQELLNFKRGEYTQGDVDLLINFKQVAAFTGTTSEEVCLTYMMKHIQSIAMAVKRNPDIKFEWKTETGEEGLAQRFSDCRNYLILLAALLVDRGEVQSKDQYTNKVFKFEGKRPELNFPVQLIREGVVCKSDQSCEFPIIGMRVENLGGLAPNEIVVRVLR